jgi:phosphoglycolate phosphatase
MQQAYEAHKLTVPARERLLSIVGLSLREAFVTLAADENHPIDSLADSYKAAFQVLRRSPQHLEPLYPGARTALDLLATRDDVILGIATGKSQRGVAAVLGHHGLVGRFLTIQTSDDAPSKPHPEMVLAAMREVCVGPDDTVMIGDTVYDIAMARAAGARAIAVAWGYHTADALAAAGPETTISDYAELVPALDAIWGSV